MPSDHKFVIDASVAVKWFYRNEDNAGIALSIFDLIAAGKVRGIIPELFFYELGNVFVNDRNAVVEVIREHWRILSELELEVVPYEDRFFNTVVSVAKQHALTFYDAAYLVIALKEECQLITEDKALLATRLPNVVPLARFSV